MDVSLHALSLPENRAPFYTVCSLVIAKKNISAEATDSLRVSNIFMLDSARGAEKMSSNS